MDKLIHDILNSPIKSCAVSLTVVSIGYFILNAVFKRPQPQAYPPGPPRDPLIGTLRSFPKDRFVERFSEWAVTYGDIVYAPMPGMEIVILNSYDAAQELLAKRPSTTGGRRLGYLIFKLMGWQWVLTFLPLGVNHSNQRKMLRRALGPQRVGSYDANIESEAAKFMTVLNTFQGNPNRIIEHCLGRLVSTVTYGERILADMGNDLSHWNLDAMDDLTEAIFSFWLVDILHFLRFVPDWIPGLRFKQLIRQGNDLSEKIRYRAYRKGVELYRTGTLGHSILNDLLEEFGENEDVQDATAVLYMAASDTTTASILQFLHVLFLFPAISERVFSEVEAVTRGHRLPQVDDRSELPYTEAVWKEAIRWSPVIPLGIPHVNDQDEVLRGYFIPKGTMIHQNTRRVILSPYLT